MPWQDVCLSVCTTHAGIVCKRLYISSMFFTIGTTILVFPHQTGWQFSDGDPLTEAPNAWREYDKNHDLRPISDFISEMMQDRAIVTMEGE